MLKCPKQALNDWFCSKRTTSTSSSKCLSVKQCKGGGGGGGGGGRRVDEAPDSEGGWMRHLHLLQPKL